MTTSPPRSPVGNGFSHELGTSRRPKLTKAEPAERDHHEDDAGEYVDDSHDCLPSPRLMHVDLRML